MKTFLVFDVESVGLHGEGFAVGYVVVDGEGKELESGLFACSPERATGGQSGRDWIKTNCPTFPDTHGFPEQVRNAFWSVWKSWKERGAILAADCAWPVEARFLIECVEDVRPLTRGGHPDGPRDWEGPYPLVDIASVIMGNGGDPLETHDRLENELPAHNPLADARQSARLLLKIL